MVVTIYIDSNMSVFMYVNILVYIIKKVSFVFAFLLYQAYRVDENLRKQLGTAGVYE